jgi:cytoskeleton protein RodZ
LPDIGNTLREARIRRGLTIADVESVTKIRARYLEALEENDFEVIPAPTYVKGFLRTYALLLKLDADALVAEYRSSYEPRNKDDVEVVGAETPARSRGRTARQQQRQKTRRVQRGYILAGVVAVVIIALLAWFGSGRGQQAASLESENLNPPSSSTQLTGGTGTSGTAAALSTTSTSVTASSSSTTSVPVAVTTGENVVLVVNVTEGSCWLVIREDSESGAELYAGTLSAGGQQTFDSAKRYWMMAGRPEVLALTVNGAAYTLSAPAGSFVITEAGVERSR